MARLALVTRVGESGAAERRTGYPRPTSVVNRELTQHFALRAEKLAPATARCADRVRIAEHPERERQARKGRSAKELGDPRRWRLEVSAPGIALLALT